MPPSLYMPGYVDFTSRSSTLDRMSFCRALSPGSAKERMNVSKPCIGRVVTTKAENGFLCFGSVECLAGGSYTNFAGVVPTGASLPASRALCVLYLSVSLSVRHYVYMSRVSTYMYTTAFLRILAGHSKHVCLLEHIA